jgi:hypothetical protein
LSVKAPFFFVTTTSFRTNTSRQQEHLTRREEKGVDLFHYKWEWKEGGEDKEGMSLETNPTAALFAM